MSAERILLAHGSGGRLSQELVTQVILPGLGAARFPLDDAAVISPNGARRLAFTADSFVVSPIFFPGGDIGDLSICGTVNDLAMMGAQPLAITLSLLIEEGLPLEELTTILASMRRRAEEARVSIVAGDTKVVERGKADGIFVNTSGIGAIPDGRSPSGSSLRPGDKIILSGQIGDHGMAVMSQREGLEFSSQITSDTAPLNQLVEAIFATGAGVNALRDPTRGGLATVLNEFAASSTVGIEIDEAAVPVRDPVRAACELLGLDPLYVANEGKLVASVPAADADRVIDAIRVNTYGSGAALIGEVTEENPGRVTMRTQIGGRRIVDMLTGEQLPRIC